MTLSEICIRDPFVLPQPALNKYFLFRSTANGGEACGLGFDAYFSRDLRVWEGPIPAFRPPPDFWATKEFWAPEVYERDGRFYMFATFKAEGACRGTQILVSDNPGGPYKPHSIGPVTPHDWECLDGTLYTDKSSDPWMVFCHEWLQTGDGTMCAIRLRSDLKESVGAPIVLFAASSAKWSVECRHESGAGKITDGPFLYENSAGHLLMLWSSGGKQGYAMGWATSRSGRLIGPWEQQDVPFYGTDGGHGMIFSDFHGGLYLALHSPNSSPNERACFIPLIDRDGIIARDPGRETIH